MHAQLCRKIQQLKRKSELFIKPTNFILRGKRKKRGCPHLEIQTRALKVTLTFFATSLMRKPFTGK